MSLDLKHKSSESAQLVWKWMEIQTLVGAATPIPTSPCIVFMLFRAVLSSRTFCGDGNFLYLYWPIWSVVHVSVGHLKCGWLINKLTLIQTSLNFNIHMWLVATVLDFTGLENHYPFNIQTKKLQINLSPSFLIFHSFIYWIDIAYFLCLVYYCIPTI